MWTDVTEFCPNCENEIEMKWDIERNGYKAFCPVCGNRLMLCDECLHAGGDSCMSCDYDSTTDSCKHNRNGVAGYTPHQLRKAEKSIANFDSFGKRVRCGNRLREIVDDVEFSCNSIDFLLGVLHGRIKPPGYEGVNRQQIVDRIEYDKGNLSDILQGLEQSPLLKGCVTEIREKYLGGE